MGDRIKIKHGRGGSGREGEEPIRGGTAESLLPLAGKIAPSEGNTTSDLAIEDVARSSQLELSDDVAIDHWQRSVSPASGSHKGVHLMYVIAICLPM